MLVGKVHGRTPCPPPRTLRHRGPQPVPFLPPGGLQYFPGDTEVDGWDLGSGSTGTSEVDLGDILRSLPLSRQVLGGVW